MIQPKWVSEWIGPDQKFEHDEETIEWIKSRPDSIKELMLKFPPSCVVKSDIPLHTADNRYGIITSYSEDGDVSIRSHPDANIRGWVKIEHLTVVDYWGGITPEVIRNIISNCSIPDC